MDLTDMKNVCPYLADLNNIKSSKETAKSKSISDSDIPFVPLFGPGEDTNLPDPEFQRYTEELNEFCKDTYPSSALVERTKLVDDFYASSKHTEDNPQRTDKCKLICKLEGIQPFSKSTVVAKPEEPRPYGYIDKHKKSYIPEEDFKKIEQSLEETWQDVVLPIQNKITGLFFDYREVQRGIQLQFEAKAEKFLLKMLSQSEEEAELQRTSQNWMPLKWRRRAQLVKVMEAERKIAKEFESIYGPVQLDNPATQQYLHQYFNLVCEKVKEMKKKLVHLRYIAANDGEDKVPSILLDQTVLLHETRQDLRVQLKEKQLIYDLNPFTNPAHLNWFMLNRSPNLDARNLFLLHEKLAFLQEYQPRPDEAENLIIIKGYWPSLFDLSANKAVNISNDEAFFEDLPEEEVEELDPVERRSLIKSQKDRRERWQEKVRKMTRMIALHPLGINLDLFFEEVKKEHRPLENLPLFENVTLEQAANKLDDLFETRKLKDFRQTGWFDTFSKREQTLLFPAYLRGILPEDTKRVLKKVWKRVIFLAEAAPRGLLDLRKVEMTYKKYFHVRIPLQDWGFRSIPDFIEWCKKEWDAVDGERVRINDYHSPNELFLEALTKRVFGDDEEDED